MDLIFDANVLIDYLDADRFVLPLLREALGTIHVPTLVLDEVKNLDEGEAVSLGLLSRASGSDGSSPRWA